MSYRCTWCRALATSGGCDELELAFHDPTSNEDTGICDDCWCIMDRARAEVVTLLFGWLAPRDIVEDE